MPPWPLWRWQEKRRGADIALAAIYLFGCASVKNEGLLLSLCVVVGLAITLFQRGERSRRDLAAVFGLLAAWGSLMAVWWWHLRPVSPVSDENYPTRLQREFLLEGLQRLPELMRELGAQVTDFATWHVIWAAFPVACVWVLRRGRHADPKALVLVMVCLLYWGGIAVIYLLSPWRDQAEHIEVTFARVFLPLLPLVILLLQRVLAAPQATA